MQNPFAEDGVWLRCALHAHTTNSDGELAPPLLVRHYEHAGFDVLALTDHWKRSIEPSTDQLLVLPGTELDASLGAPGRNAHVLGLGVEADPVEPGSSFPGLEETVSWIREAGGLPFLAHPYWSGLNAAEFAGCEGLLGLEVYNAACELEVGRGLASVHWDDVLETDGRTWFGIASDDSHHPGFDSSFAWTWVRARERIAGAVLDALRAGSFLQLDGTDDQGRRRARRHGRGEDDARAPRDPDDRSHAGRQRQRGSARLFRARRGTGAVTGGGDHRGAPRRPAPSAVRTPGDRGFERRQSLDEPPLDLSWRSAALELLGDARFDLLVIGGGIIGAGIAAEASRAGLAVALVDRGDFGGATSSASSKLIHGGLRYLGLGDIRLVREAHQERRALMRIVAPHLVRRLTFLLPLYENGPYRRLTIQTALWLYSTLARERLGGVLEPERAAKSVPALRLDSLQGCGLYSDAWTHDGRLCLANVRAAAERGAVILNHAEVVELHSASGRAGGALVRDRLGGESVGVEARAIVNATGPWIDRVRRLEDPAAQPSSRLSKGVHALLALDEPWSAALIVPHDRVRVSFAVPWEGMLLLGTTDELFEGDPEDAAPTDEDVDQILGEAAVALDSSVARRDAVRATFAGLRVLPGAGDTTVNVRRETVLLRGPQGMLTIAGGKLTTYRRIALAALNELRSDLGLHRIDRAPAALPGAADLHETAQRIARAQPDLELPVRLHLAHLYGALAGEVLEAAERNPTLLERLHPDAPDIAAQVVYAREREWACTEEDVLARRTTLALRGLQPEPAKLSA